MNFRSIMMDDIDRAFLNLCEFADVHDINGCQVPAVIDTADAQTQQLADAQGIFSSTIKIYVKQNSLVSLPLAGDTITVNSYRYTVLKTSLEQGVDVIEAATNEV